MSKKHIVVALTVILVSFFLFVACGKKEVKKEVSNEPVKKVEKVQLDCKALVPQMGKCIKQFAAEYKKTKWGSNVEGMVLAFEQKHNRDTIGKETCEKNWQSKDPRWLERMSKYDASSSCDVFVKYMADAIGNPHPIPK